MLGRSITMKPLKIQDDSGFTKNARKPRPKAKRLTANTGPINGPHSFPDRLTVRLQTLTLSIEVRILIGEPFFGIMYQLQEGSFR